jgi:hypothetical protein
LAIDRGIKPQDEIYSAAALLNVIRVSGENVFYIEGTAGYQFHQANSILNGEHIDVEGGARRKMGRCDIAAFGTYLRMISDLNTLAASVATNSETDGSVLLGTSCGKGTPFSVSIAVSPQWSVNSNPVMQSSNYRSATSEASVGYSSSRLGLISLFGSFNSTIFPNRAVPIGSSNESDAFRTYGGGIRWEKKFGYHLRLSGSVSALTLASSNPGDPRFSGIDYDTEIIYTPVPRLEADISASRMIEPTDRLNVTYSIDETYRATLGYALGRKIKLSVDGSLTHQRYFGAQINPSVDLTEQAIQSISASLSYELRPKFLLKCTATKETGGADLAPYRYNDARIVLSLSAAS